MAKATIKADTKNTVLAAFDEVIKEARAEFEAEKAAAAAEWKKELARMKEEDLYNYNKDKRDREDKLEQELNLQKQEVIIREAAVEAREAAADELEATVASLQEQVTLAEAKISSAETNGYYQGTISAQKEAASEAKILEAERNAEERILKGQVEHLENEIKAYAEANASLTTLLADANKRVEMIATNAVQAAGQSKVTVQTATAGK